MAHAGDGHTDENLATPGWIQLDLLDRELAGFTNYCGGGPHRIDLVSR